MSITKAIAVFVLLACIGVVAPSKSSYANGFAYVLDQGQRNVAVISLATNTVVADIRVGLSPRDIAITPDGSLIYVPNYSHNTVSVISTATNTVVETVGVSIQPWQTNITPDGNFVYVTHEGDTVVSVISTATNAIVDSVQLSNVAANLKFTPDGAFAYALVRFVGVEVISTATNTVVDTISQLNSATSIEFTPDGAFAYITQSFSAIVSVVSTASHTVVDTVGIDLVDDYGTPMTMHFSLDGATIYMTSLLDQTVSVVSTASNTEIDTVEAGSLPISSALTPNGSLLYVANHLEDTVTVISTATNTVLTTIDIDDPPLPFGASRFPATMAITTDGDFVYLATAIGNVSVISTRTNTLVDEIEAVGSLLRKIVVTPESNAAGRLPNLQAMGNVNSNNRTDLGVLLRETNTGKNKLYVMDGGSGNKIRTVLFGSEQVRGVTTTPDANGDLVPEFSVLVEGSLFARAWVKDVVNKTLLGKPGFNANYKPVAFLSVGETGGNAGPDLAMVGRQQSTGNVKAWVKEAESGNLVQRITFSKAFVPFAAVALDNVGDSAAMEIAVLGINATGKVQAQVKDAMSGNQIGNVSFSRNFTPLFFAAVPDANGELTNLAVLGRNANGVIRVQVKRVIDGTKIGNVKFSKSYVPRAFISFADSNSSGGGEVGVVGINGNDAVRAQVKEIANGATVKNTYFSKNFPPLDAIAINGVAGTGRNEIALLGENPAGQLRLQIKDLLSGNLVNNIPVP